ncbi:MAG TPA: NAD(P)(+) transhydrogenase (Re/Si-specific) subunit beta [Sphingomicrobium sp.]|nr:NAD(P)(+) transhydrogenase (Re/Si-specific) subunit beta [Sphingomicrobium sp.]
MAEAAAHAQPAWVLLAYLVAGVCFILALRGLSSPESSRRGNFTGMVGMTIAVVTTLTTHEIASLPEIIGAMVIGGGVGLVTARKIQMTAMPQLVAAFHSLVGMAAVLVGAAAYLNPEAFGIAVRITPIASPSIISILPVSRIEMGLGVAIGAITFSGSVIAFLKLNGNMSGKPILLPLRHFINLGTLAAILGLIAYFTQDQSPWVFGLLTALSFAIGFLLIIPIGGADMPVVISMLNSYSGWAAAGIGFSLNNPMLIVAGSLVGSSGAILSYIMCKAMNRSFINVILGGFGAEPGAAAAGAEQKSVKSGSPDDAAFIMENAESVIIVPGYGLAVARAQHAVKEMAEKLRAKGVTVKYAIHPVAGRMPGHMNVLLAEAEVPYDQVFEMEDINGEFGEADVALILGANDVVNPAAKDPKSPIAGMPILEAYKARQVIVNKRSMASGYAGLDNELFYMPKTMMVFGDAKKVVEEIVKAIQ